MMLCKLKRSIFYCLALMGIRCLSPPPIGVSSSHTKAKFMKGMDKRYDGHVWTKTQTINISKDLGLVFRSSTYDSHLECHNPNCDFLQRPHRTSIVNDIDFNNFTNEPFPVGGPLPLGSTLIYRICKKPPKCIAPCHTKIFYVHHNDITQCACFIWASIPTPSRSATA